MKSLSIPNIDPSQMLTECIEGIKNEPIRDHYTANQLHLEQGIVDFTNASAATSWCFLPRVPRGDKTRVIVGQLTKEQLTELYSTHLVRSSGAPRQKYDELLVAADGKCPFCGGIGHVKTLDHYLPKANFPLYSIVPTNLVPCCRDCNSEKRNSFPTTANMQTIHPYLDGEHFFREKWTLATINRTDPISVQFEASPPLT